MAEKLIGTWKLKSCRHLAEDGYCDAWELSKEEGARIYGEEVKELFETKLVERSVFFYVERVEVYSLKPNASVCFHCQFFERR